VAVQAQLIKLLDRVRSRTALGNAGPGGPHHKMARWHGERSGPEPTVAPLTKSLAREVGWTDEARAAAAAARAAKASKAGGLTADERGRLNTARQTLALPVEQTEHDERVWAQAAVNELGAKDQVGKLGKLGGTKGLAGLSVPERHQLNVARQTLRMSPEMAGVMGGMTHDEAQDVVKRLTNKAARVSRGERDSVMRDLGMVKVKGNLGGTYYEAIRWLKKLGEAMGISAAAPLMRKGVQARLADDEDVPVGALKSDLKRKLSLRQVMGKPQDDDEEDEQVTMPSAPAIPAGFEDEGILDDLFGDDDEQKCHDEFGNEIDCDDPDAVDAPSDDDTTEAVGDPKTPESPDFGHAIDRALYKTKAPDEIPEDQQQYSKEQVNYRWASVPGQSCGECRFFMEPGACQLVAGLIRPVDVCDKFQPKENKDMVRASLVTSSREARREGRVVHFEPHKGHEREQGTVPGGLEKGLSDGYKRLAIKRQGEMNEAYTRSAKFGTKPPFRISEREVAPPGWEGTVKAMKKHPDIDNPWALSWYMKGKGDVPHK